MKTQAVLLIVGGMTVAGILIYRANRPGNMPSSPTANESPAPPTSQAIAWVRSFSDGMAKAKSAGKPMLIHFHGPG